MASQCLVTLFNELIDNKLYLKKNGSQFIIEEDSKKASHTCVAVSGISCFGFTLDTSEMNVFPAFTDSITKIKEVCDAIVIAKNKGRTFIFSIEMKSNPNKQSKAISQINNSRFFCNWVCELLKKNTTWNGEYQFYGIISLPPRRQARKRASKKESLKVEEKNNLEFLQINSENISLN